MFLALVQTAGVAADLQFTVIYDTDLETLAREFAARTGNSIEFSRQVWTQSTGIGLSGALMMNAAAPSWASAPDTQRAKIMAHEIYHVAQYAWTGGDLTGRVGDDAVPRGGPRWLIEGSAELAGYRAAATDPIAFASARADQITRVRGTTVPLRDLELLAGMNGAGSAAYPLAFIAVEYLTRNQGLSALPSFWQRIAGGQQWPAAFAAQFGLSVDAFYAEFAIYRAGL